MNNSTNKQNQCFVDDHFVELIQNQIPCNGKEVTLFEDITDNHNKTTIFVDVFDVDPSCMVTAVIDTRDGKTIEEPIPTIFGFGERTFFVENVCRVAVRGDHVNGYGIAQPSYPTTFDTRIDIQKTFCICCNEEKDKHDCDRCEDSKHSEKDKHKCD